LKLSLDDNPPLIAPVVNVQRVPGFSGHRRVREATDSFRPMRSLDTWS